MPELQTKQVLKLLFNSKKSLTCYEVMVKLEDMEVYVSRDYVQVMLSQMKRNGLVKGEREHCSCCGHRSMRYSLAEDGKMRAKFL